MWDRTKPSSRSTSSTPRGCTRTACASPARPRTRPTRSRTRSPACTAGCRAGEPIEHPRAYLFATARNACLRRVDERRRVAVVAEPPEVAAAGEVPEAELGVLTSDLQAEVRAAQRPPARPPARGPRAARGRGDVLRRHRRAHGPPAEAAAQLAWRARLGLRTALRRGALSSIAPASEACAQRDDAARAERGRRPARRRDRPAPRPPVRLPALPREPHRDARGRAPPTARGRRSPRCRSPPSSCSRTRRPRCARRACCARTGRRSLPPRCWCGSLSGPAR